MKYLKKYNSFFVIISVLLLSFLLSFYIFIGCKSIINSDSTFIVDYALEIIDSNSLFPNTWYNTNDFWIYSLIPLITIFIKFGMNLFLARQLSVFIQTIILFLILYDLYNNCFKDKKGFVITSLMFLSGISGQFIFEMFGDATYGTIVLFMLISVWLYIKYIISNKKLYLLVFGIFLLLITSCSLRFPIYIGAPIICYVLYTIYDKGFSKDRFMPIIVCFVSIIMGYIIHIILSKSLLFVSSYGIGISNDVSILSENIFRTIFNYFFVCGSTYLNNYSLFISNFNEFIKSTSSPLIVFLFIKGIFAIINLVIPFLLFKVFKKLEEFEKLLLIYTSTFVFIMIFFMIIGGMTWYRYMTPIIFFLILLYPLFYKYYIRNKEKNMIVFHVTLLLFIFSSVLFSTYSYFHINTFKIRENRYQEFTDLMISKGYSFGYILDNNETSLYHTLSNGKLQVVPLNIDGKSQMKWLSSTRWIDKNYYKGKVFFIRADYQKHVELEKYANEYFEYYGEDHFYVYVFDNNDIIIDYLRKDK